MGAFIYIKKDPGVTLTEIKTRYKSSIEVFDRMGLRLNHVIEGERFVVLTYDKYFFSVKNFWVEDQRNFIIGSGTLFYKRKTEDKALAEIFRDLKTARNIADVANQIQGNYCVLTCLEGQIFVFNEVTGSYHVFYDREHNIVSNSFLAVSKSLSKRTPSVQEIYEYGMYGTIYGGKSFFEEVDLLDSKKITVLQPVFATISRGIDFSLPILNKPEDYFIDRLSDLIKSYFWNLKDNFPAESVYCAMTGGFDTRLMLAAMRSIGLTPTVYVYNYGGADAAIARDMAKGEGYNLFTWDYFVFPPFQDSEFEHLVLKAFYMNDGKSDSGIFHEGSDWYMRSAYFKNARIHMNGYGGECLRNHTKVIDRDFTIREFLKIKYDRFDYPRLCSGAFNKANFFYKLGEKIKGSIALSGDRLSRQQIEIILPINDYQFWGGINQSNKGRFTHSITPLMDLNYLLETFQIPLKYKSFALLNTHLIRTLDAELSQYRSAYGFTFYNGPSFRYKTLNTIKYFTPLWLRPFLRRNLWKKQLSRKAFPLTIEKKHLDKLFGKGPLEIERYFNLYNVSSQKILSRLYTLELHLKNQF